MTMCILSPEEKRHLAQMERMATKPYRGRPYGRGKAWMWNRNLRDNHPEKRKEDDTMDDEEQERIAKIFIDILKSHDFTKKSQMERELSEMSVEDWFREFTI